MFEKALKIGMCKKHIATSCRFYYILRHETPIQKRTVKVIKGALRPSNRHLTVYLAGLRRNRCHTPILNELFNGQNMGPDDFGG